MKIKPTHPLISCICITAYRPDKLLKAIANFDNQNYPNKELIISYLVTDTVTRELLHRVISIFHTKLLMIPRSPELSLGAARNAAISYSKAEYVAIWDDDDYHHWMRLMYQFNHMQRNGTFRSASVLSRVLLYDSEQDRVFISHISYWCGTLLCSKKLLLKFPCEDNDIDELGPIIKYLERNRYADEIEDSPQLYIFIYHGKNSREANDFEQYQQKGRLLDEEDSDLVRPFIHEKYNLL